MNRAQQRKNIEIYKGTNATNRRLVAGEEICMDRRPACPFSGTRAPRRRKRISYPRIGLYTGAGVSHSWLWFAEIFDRMGFYDTVFLDETRIDSGGLNNLDVLAVSGGDTFAIAQGLGERGARELEAFIAAGGVYMGSCAGAYLPLNSSKTALKPFNFVPAKISNLSTRLPEPRRLEDKFCSAYGCAYIFHPVREEVRVRTTGLDPFGDIRSLTAPLYGGPPMIASDSCDVLAEYSGFSDKTLFLTDEKLARQTVLGKAAVIRKKLGAGRLYLFGPHFEHPFFPEANRLMADAMYWDVPGDRVPVRPLPSGVTPVEGSRLKDLMRDLKRQISNARITAAAMETLPTRWIIGTKVYEPAKFRDFIESIWTRAGALEGMPVVWTTPGQAEWMIDLASEAVSLLREIKRGIHEGADTLEAAERAFKVLNKTCALFHGIYFRARFHQWAA